MRKCKAALAACFLALAIGAAPARAQHCDAGGPGTGIPCGTAVNPPGPDSNARQRNREFQQEQAEQRRAQNQRNYEAEVNQYHAITGAGDAAIGRKDYVAAIAYYRQALAFAGQSQYADFNTTRLQAMLAFAQAGQAAQANDAKAALAFAEQARSYGAWPALDAWIVSLKSAITAREQAAKAHQEVDEYHRSLQAKLPSAPSPAIAAADARVRDYLAGSETGAKRGAKSQTVPKPVLFASGSGMAAFGIRANPADPGLIARPEAVNVAVAGAGGQLKSVAASGQAAISPSPGEIAKTNSDNGFSDQPREPGTALDYGKPIPPADRSPLTDKVPTTVSANPRYQGLIADYQSTVAEREKALGAVTQTQKELDALAARQQAAASGVEQQAIQIQIADATQRLSAAKSTVAADDIHLADKKKVIQKTVYEIVGDSPSGQGGK